MATFDEDEITDLAEILGTNSDLLDAHLDLYASVITDSDKTKVLARVTEWAAVDNDTVTIEPMERNFGVRKGSSSTRSLIAQRIAALLHWPYTVTGQMSLVRG